MPTISTLGRVTELPWERRAAEWGRQDLLYGRQQQQQNDAAKMFYDLALKRLEQTGSQFTMTRQDRLDALERARQEDAGFEKWYNAPPRGAAPPTSYAGVGGEQITPRPDLSGGGVDLSQPSEGPVPSRTPVSLPSPGSLEALMPGLVGGRPGGGMSGALRNPRTWPEGYRDQWGGVHPQGQSAGAVQFGAEEFAPRAMQIAAGAGRAPGGAEIAPAGAPAGGMQGVGGGGSIEERVLNAALSRMEQPPETREGRFYRGQFITRGGGGPAPMDPEQALKVVAAIQGLRSAKTAAERAAAKDKMEAALDAANLANVRRAGKAAEELFPYELESARRGAEAARKADAAAPFEEIAKDETRSMGERAQAAAEANAIYGRQKIKVGGKRMPTVALTTATTETGTILKQLVKDESEGFVIPEAEWAGEIDDIQADISRQLAAYQREGNDTADLARAFADRLEEAAVKLERAPVRFGHGAFVQPGRNRTISRLHALAGQLRRGPR